MLILDQPSGPTEEGGRAGASDPCEASVPFTGPEDGGRRRSQAQRLEKPPEASGRNAACCHLVQPRQTHQI